jgi:hypothetical protein
MLWKRGVCQSWGRWHLFWRAAACSLGEVTICSGRKMMCTQGQLDYNWFYSLKTLAHFRSKVFVDFLHYVTQINSLTGAIIARQLNTILHTIIIFYLHLIIADLAGTHGACGPDWRHRLPGPGGWHSESSRRSQGDNHWWAHLFCYWTGHSLEIWIRVDYVENFSTKL